MRKKLLVKNTVSSLAYQICNLICVFILPRLILVAFGSSVNGLVNSIDPFLRIISLLDLGVGAVVQSSLYKPLAEKNELQISRIVTFANRFFRKIAAVLLAYSALLMVFYPMIVKNEFSHLYTALLIAAMCVSSFAQYYFGIVDRLFLTAAQHGYITYNVQTITLIVNTVACAVLIKFGYGIHIVKLTTSLIFLVRPVLLRMYTNKHYKINRREQYTEEPVQQKWNGIAQHVASVVLDYTDTIVLTLFAKLSDVSIYSVYHMVVYGIKSVFMSLTSGIQAVFGDMWAKKETEKLNKFFDFSEWAIHTAATLIFGITGIMIIPFVKVYTKGITDAQYVNIAFAVLIVAAQFCHSIRLPYNLMILAVGHYKQTQNNYIIAASMNIVISVVTVKMWGLVGVAIGTLCAMLYQTVWMAYYISKKLLNRKFSVFFKSLLLDIVTAAVGILATIKINIAADNYFSLVIYAVLISLIWCAVVLVINLLINRDKVSYMFKALGKKIKR